MLAIACGDDESPATTTDAATGNPQTTSDSSDEATDSGPSSATTSDAETTEGPTTADGADGSSTGMVGMPCEYPEGAVEPMALGEVLWPYSWPVAIDGNGTEVSLELEDAPCGFDEVIEWSPHDVLVFISIPAW